MNTTAAAIEAGVTPATIRDWARRNVIAATKQAGRWIIDAASLAHRITLGQRKAKKSARPITLTLQNMIAIGGNEWIRGDKHRVYINNWADFAGLEITRYNSGNISSASIGGRPIANGRVDKVLHAIDKVYFDATDGQLYFQQRGAREFEIRYLNGERDYLDLVALTCRGIRAAIAAL